MILYQSTFSWYLHVKKMTVNTIFRMPLLWRSGILSFLIQYCIVSLTQSQCPTSCSNTSYPVNIRIDTFRPLNSEKYLQTLLLGAKQLTVVLKLIAASTSKEITHYFSQVQSRKLNIKQGKSEGGLVLASGVTNHSIHAMTSHIYM